MAGRSIKAGGGGKVTDLSTARKAKAGDRKDDGVPKNNLQAMREQEEAQLLSVLSQMRPALARVEEAKAVVKERVAEVDSILDKAAAQGFKKGEIRDLLKDTAVKGSRKDLREVEERRARFRRYLGLPVGETDDGLLDAIPEAAKDELDWEGAGYTAGVRADEPKPPSNCPDRFHQAWMKGYHNGQARNAWAAGGGKGSPPDPVAEVLPPAEALDQLAEQDKLEENFEASPEELAAQAQRPAAAEDEAV